MQINRRVLIFADADNTFFSAQSFNRKIDWHKIRDYLADPEEGRELIEMVIYIGLPPGKDRFEEQRKTKEKFIYWARSNGFLVVSKEGKAKGDEYETNVDVVMEEGFGGTRPMKNNEALKEGSKVWTVPKIVKG